MKSSRKEYPAVCGKPPHAASAPTARGLRKFAQFAPADAIVVTALDCLREGLRFRDRLSIGLPTLDRGAASMISRNLRECQVHIK